MFTIRLAENCGFCYGVKRAVTMAEKAADSKDVSYTLGPIIHNPQVVGKLESNGVYAINELGDVEEGTIIIRSHGVGPEIYEEAAEPSKATPVKTPFKANPTNVPDVKQ